MDWEITIHEDKEYIEIVTHGHADKDGSMNMARVISETMRKNKINKALIDHSNLTGVSGKVVDVYQRPTLFKIIGVILGIKIAEVVRPEHIVHFRFFETVCINRGYKFSIFHNKASALTWLLS